MWLIVIFLVTALVGLAFNACILVSVIRYRALRKKHYAILVSLACCDMFKVVVIISITVQSLVANKKLCVATSSLGMTLICITTLHLAMESLNRCFVVASPYNYDIKITKVKVAAVIAMLWITPVLMTVVIPVFWNNSFHFQSQMFGCQHTSRSVHIDLYIVLVHIVFFAVPLAVMIVSHGFLLKLAYKSAKELREMQIRSDFIKSPIVSETRYSKPIIDMIVSSFEASAVSPTANIKHPIEHKNKAERVVSFAGREISHLMRNKSVEIKASKTVFIIFVPFIVCNTPIFSATWTQTGSQVDTDLKQFLIGLAFLQIFIDPIVYFLRLKDFKDSRKTIRAACNFAISEIRRKLNLPNSRKTLYPCPQM